MQQTEKTLIEVGEKMMMAASIQMDAAHMIVNGFQEIKSTITSLANRNYNEIRASQNALKSFVS